MGKCCKVMGKYCEVMGKCCEVMGEAGGTCGKKVLSSFAMGGR